MNPKIILDKINFFDKNFSKNNERLNCFTLNLISDAKEKFQKYSEKQLKGRLFGKLISVKDNINIKGFPTTCSSAILDGYISLFDATVIDSLVKEGGLIAGKTNMDEFAMGSSNEFSIFGSCKNPHNLDYVSGGSSGGSAVSVASGLVDISLGSDTGGSVRQPASFCGIYGLKPTYGRISRYGLIAFASSFDQIGVFAKDLDDIINTFESISGVDPMDSTTSLKDMNFFNSSNKKVEKIKVGIPDEYFTKDLQPEIKEAISRIEKKLKINGIEVSQISLKHTKECISAYYILTTAEAASNLSRYDGVRYGKRYSSENLLDMYKQTRSSGFGPEVKRRIIMGNFVLSSGYYNSFYGAAQKIRRLIKNDFINVFKDVDIIMAPTSPSTAFKISEKIKDPMQMYLSDIFTVPASLAGIPAMSVPIGFDNKGLPMGMQLMANYFKENDIFKMSEYIKGLD